MSVKWYIAVMFTFVLSLVCAWWIGNQCAKVDTIRSCTCTTRAAEAKR